jgi:hypothetical protein
MHRWIDNLPNIVNEAGLELLKFRIEPFSKACTAIATRPFVLSHIPGLNAVYSTGHAALPSREEADALLEALIRAVKHGAAYHQRYFSVLAQKPVRG